jgi:hypothetical protein
LIVLLYLNRYRLFLLLYPFSSLSPTFTSTSRVAVVHRILIFRIPACVPLNDVYESRLDHFDVASCEMCESREFHVATICCILTHAPKMFLYATVVIDERGIAWLVLCNPITNILADESMS